MSDNSNQFWWNKPKGKVHEPLQEYVKKLNNEQNYRAEDNLRHMRLYGNQESLGFDLRQYSRTNKAQNRVTLNVIQSMIDTVVSKISKSQPKPMYLTDGGDWSEQRKAKKLNQFTQGQFYSNKIYEISPRILADAMVFGTGVVKVFSENGDTRVERVFPNEIIVDDVEAIYGQPRQMHQGKWVHKEVLKQMFPKFEGEIDVAKTDLQSTPFSLSRSVNMIYVIESWHLPSGKGAKDGRHAITIDGATLIDEPYKRNYFPFVFLKWSPRLLGFFGQGLAEQLQGIQVEINRILKTIQVGMRVACVPRVLIDRASGVVDSQINNLENSIVRYSGIAPQFWNASGAIPQELFAHLDRLYQRAFEIAGISQLSAQSKKPAGLDSGKALRAFNDIESERFLDLGRRYEDFHIELARQLLYEARDIGSNYEVQAPGKKFLKTLKLKDCDLDDSKYIMQVFPTSALSKTPAARLAEVQELLNAGVISPEAAKKLLDYPDLQAEVEASLAAEEDIEWVIDQIVDEGVYLSPDPYENLNLGIEKMQRAYLQFRQQNLPEDRLELLRVWISDANAMLNPPQQELPPTEMPIMDPSMMPAPVDPMAIAAAEQQNPPPAPPPMDPAMMMPIVA
jgi:hypothetical protein